MRNIATCIATVLTLIFSSNVFSSSIRHDLDLDNITDVMDVGPFSIDDDQVAEMPIKITYSKSGSTFSTVIKSESGSIDAYPGMEGGELIIDYSIRSSRDSSELNYEVYKWSEEHQSLCLHISISGTPKNQLKKELLPKISYVNLYDACIGMDSTTPKFPISTPQVQWDTIPPWTIPFTEKMISEWAALEISARMGIKISKHVENIADTQVKLENYEQAAILYQALINMNPNNHMASIALATLLFDYGDKSNACKIYGSTKRKHATIIEEKLFSSCLMYAK